MPAYNTRALLPLALESVLTQSFTDLEVVVIDDGSTDGSGDIARSVAAQDPRVRVIPQANAGLGAARNTGAELARGEFLTFCDSDDVVLPRAYETMVGQLRRTGSQFVAGVMIRGEHEGSAIRPGWMARVMGEDRTCLRIEDHPWMLLDITAPNKVFRRSFWRAAGLHFPVGVRYEDQLPITTAFMRADSFDVVRRPVYLWRTRLDGSSISQQKANPVDLSDRILSQEQSVPLFANVGQDIKETWYLKLLDFDMPAYLAAGLSNDDAYFSALSRRLEEIRLEAPAHTWQGVAFPNRARAWLLSHGDRAAGTSLQVWLERNGKGLPVRVVDGKVEYAVPDDIGTDKLPSSLRRVQDVDVRPVVRLTEVRWRGHELVLRGSAFMTPLVSSYADHQLDLTVGAGEFSCSVPLKRHSDPWFADLSGRAFEDRSDSGFEAVIDTAALARVLPDGQHSLPLDFTHRQGDFTRHSAITHLVHTGSGGNRAAAFVDGRMVRLAGVVSTDHRLLVHDTYAVLTGAESARDDAQELVLRVPERDEVVIVELIDVETSKSLGEVPFTIASDNTVRVVVRPTDEPAVLRTRHRSGRRARALWGSGPNAVGDPERGSFVHRGLAQLVTVGPLAPTVVVSEVSFTEEGALLRGTSLGAEGRRLVLSGSRAESAESAPLPNGEFSQRVPLTSDPWHAGPQALPEGSYTLSSRAPITPTSSEPAPDDVRHLTTSELREQLPPEFEGPGQWLRAGISAEWNLLVFSNALSQRERSALEQQRLRDVAYREARLQESVPVMLLESFGGKSTGDSPAAIAEELLRRGSDLDLVWSVVDGSVPIPPGTRAVHRFGSEWYDLLARAAYLVNNNNFPFFFQVAEGQTYLQVWHGTPLKRIGHDIPDKRYLSVSYMQTMDSEAAAWDMLVSPSEYCSAIFPRAFRYDGPVVESGYPRNDILARPEGADRAREVRERLDIAPDQQVILYAPTWRESARVGGSYAKVLHLDPDRLARRLPDSVILVRGHSNSAGAPSVRGTGGSRVLDVTLYPDVNDLFLVSDALVTDYSSVMFDFAVLDRPLLFLVPDLEHYRDTLRGFYFDFEAEAPGPLCASEAELIAALAALPVEAPGHAERRARFRQRFASLDDGGAAGRVVDALLGEARG